MSSVSLVDFEIRNKTGVTEAEEILEYLGASRAKAEQLMDLLENEYIAGYNHAVEELQQAPRSPAATSGEAPPSPLATSNNFWDKTHLLCSRHGGWDVVGWFFSMVVLLLITGPLVYGWDRTLNLFMDDTGWAAVFGILLFVLLMAQWPWGEKIHTSGDFE